MGKTYSNWSGKIVRAWAKIGIVMHRSRFLGLPLGGDQRTASFRARKFRYFGLEVHCDRQAKLRSTITSKGSIC